MKYKNFVGINGTDISFSELTEIQKEKFREAWNRMAAERIGYQRVKKAKRKSR